LNYIKNKRKLPNRDYAPEKLFLGTYGNIDKTIAQGKTMETMIEFVLDGLSIIKKVKDKKAKAWTDNAYSLLKYWDECTKISKIRSAIRYEYKHGGNNARNNQS
jgi:hypothetical protein